MKSKTAMPASAGREAVAVEQLAREGGEEALTEGIVVGIPDAPHGRSDARLAAAEPEGDRGVLTPLIGVMDHGGWPSVRHGMFNASSTSSVRRCVAIAQPITRRLHVSRTTAR
jgi:hypothetical protein